MTSDNQTGLAPRRHPGGERRLSDKQHRQLERLLLKGAKAHGWSNDLCGSTHDVDILRAVYRHSERETKSVAGAIAR